MKTLISSIASLALGLGVGLTASAQTGDQGAQSKGQDGKSHQQQDLAHRTTICGEIAGVSVVGETVVEPASGRGMAAELTYVTILGSPADAGKQAASGREGQKRDDRAGKRSESDRKDQGSAQDGSDEARKGDRPADERSGSRRRVYQIAVGPKTDVCSRPACGHESGGNKEGRAGSSGEASPSDFEILQLGDRVEIEFTPISGQGGSGAGRANAVPQTRHGRHRIVHGVASKITVLRDDECSQCKKSASRGGGPGQGVGPVKGRGPMPGRVRGRAAGPPPWP